MLSVPFVGYISQLILLQVAHQLTTFSNILHRSFRSIFLTALHSEASFTFSFFAIAQLEKSGVESLVVVVSPDARSLEADNDVEMPGKFSPVEFRDIPRDRADTSIKDNPVTSKEDISFAKDNAASRKDGAKSHSEENNGTGPADKAQEIKNLHTCYTQGKLWWFEQKSDGKLSAIYPPEDIEKFAVIHRLHIASDDVNSHSIVINSPHLKEALKTVFQDYPEIDFTSSSLRIMAPFLCFVYRWEQFKAAKDEAARHPETKAYMDPLYNMMEKRLRNSVEAREHCFKTRTVTFLELCTIYPPGSGVMYRGNDNNPVYGREPGYCRHLQAFQVIRWSYKPTTDGKQLFVLEYKFIGMWQGLAWYQDEVKIPQYEGRKEFAALPLPPLEGDERQVKFTKLLCERGQKFVNLASSSARLKECDRGALSRRKCDYRGGGIEVEGRIMLGGENDGLDPGDYKLLQRLQANQDGVFTSPSSSSSESSSSQVPPNLAEDQLMYASPVIRAWSFKKEAWMDLLVDGIRDVQFHEKALQSVMLPKAARVGIQTFLKCMAAGPHHDQAIHLVGGPGTGKTHTAEAIAEVCQKPLIAISADDLGIKSSIVERKLREVFKKAAAWNAWVLIKRCDEFLRKPTTSDSKTWWELKPIFRQYVSDFKGLVFFSSDRIQDLQPYLQDRIGLHVDLPALGPEQRAQLWTSFVKNSASYCGLRQYDLPKDKMEQLIRIALNGKQIEQAEERWILSASHDGLQLENLISIVREVQKVGRGCRPAHGWVDDDDSGSGEN